MRNLEEDLHRESELSGEKIKKLNSKIRYILLKVTAYQREVFFAKGEKSTFYTHRNFSFV